MLWPVVLLLVAGSSATWLAYGLDPLFAERLGGLRFILITRQIQWILLTLSVVPCLVLVARVALNRNRSIWLIGMSVCGGDAVFAILAVAGEAGPHLGRAHYAARYRDARGA